MSKAVLGVVIGFLAFAVVISLILYSGEVTKNRLLRSENLKTASEAQDDIKKAREEAKSEKAKIDEERQKLLDQMNAALRDRDSAVNELDTLKKQYLHEREYSLVANEDLNKLRAEVSQARTESRSAIGQLEDSFKKKRQNYETRILTLEAETEKFRKRLAAEGERYHYNLGVIYTQTKEFDLAVQEFKTALAYNPQNADAHYNLGIIFDDYFKDKDNAQYHYRTFLELRPTSDDAESVREWLKNLEKKK